MLALGEGPHHLGIHPGGDAAPGLQLPHRAFLIAREVRLAVNPLAEKSVHGQVISQERGRVREDHLLPLQVVQRVNRGALEDHDLPLARVFLRSRKDHPGMLEAGTGDLQAKGHPASL